VASHYQTFSSTLLKRLKVACREQNISFDTLGSLDVELGAFYAKTVQQLLAKTDVAPNQIAAIGSHGQTVQHSPDLKIPFTLQLGDPNKIAEKTGVRVVSDFRRRDMAAGGQGAPLTPAFHHAFFHTTDENRLVLNLGGIANITYLPAKKDEPIIGFDCGPANTLMDQWCQLKYKQHFDKNGEIARSGYVNEALLSQLSSDQYFHKNYPKSTGPEYFSRDWLTSKLQKQASKDNDVLRTLCELSALTIASSIASLPQCERLLVCGGGIHNSLLMERISYHLNCPVENTAAYGIDADWIEAMAFAWLAKQTLDGKPGNIPSVTGAKKAVILGAVYSA
jgi:anhydro-N-acetylmuramic acid kinase